MASGITGHVLNELARIEHDPASEAKRARLITLNDSASGWVTPQSHVLTNSTALGVVLIDTDGNRYVASGGGSSTVTVGGGFITIQNPTVTVGGGSIEVTNQVSATVSIPDTVTTTVSNQVSATVSIPMGEEIRTRTIYIGTSQEELPNFGSPLNGIALKARSDNPASIFVGPGSSVNGTVDDVNSGVELEPGDAATIPVNSPLDLHAIAPGGTGVLTMFLVTPS